MKYYFFVGPHWYWNPVIAAIESERIKQRAELGAAIERAEKAETALGEIKSRAVEAAGTAEKITKTLRTALQTCHRLSNDPCVEQAAKLALGEAERLKPKEEPPSGGITMRDVTIKLNGFACDPCSL